jgi:hypothetical protein
LNANPDPDHGPAEPTAWDSGIGRRSRSTWLLVGGCPAGAGRARMDRPGITFLPRVVPGPAVPATRGRKPPDDTHRPRRPPLVTLLRPDRVRVQDARRRTPAPVLSGAARSCAGELICL